MADRTVRSAPSVETLTRVASFYYLDNRTQEDIARELRISRATVGRFLRRARDDGIVDINVNLHPSLAGPLESAMVERFSLRGAVVVAENADERAQRIGVARAAVQLLDRTLTEGKVLAVGMGRNLKAVASHSGGVQRLGGTVVSAIGGSSRFEEGLNSNEVAAALASSLGARSEGLYAPAYAESSALRDLFLAHPDIARVVELARTADVLLVGVGDANPDSLVIRMNAISSREMDAMRESGAVGDILGSFFDLRGRPAIPNVDDRVVGLRREDLAAIPTVIAVVSEPTKTRAALGALRSGLVHHLVTTAPLAISVLDSR